MAHEAGVPREETEEQRPAGLCDPERVLRTLRVIEKGTRQAFLDDELGVEETKTILDRIREAKEACEGGDEDACIALDRLTDKLVKG